MSKKRKRKKPNIRERRPEPTPPPTTTLMPAPEEIEEAARRLYYEIEDGEIIDQMINNGRLTARAYLSQIKAAQEGGEGWGPPITPYEDRMTRSLQLKLLREKRQLMEKCRQRVREELEAAAAQQITAQPAPARRSFLTDEASAKSVGEGGKAGVESPMTFNNRTSDETTRVSQPVHQSPLTDEASAKSVGEGSSPDGTLRRDVVVPGAVLL